MGQFGGRNNVNIIVQQDGKEITLDNNGVKVMASENEDLKIKITDYEAQIENLKDEKNNLEKDKQDLANKLGVANGALDEVPVIEFKNYGLSIDGEEKTINKDRSCLSINGRKYFSQDFVNNLLPDNKSAIEKDDMIYIGKIVKEKSNLFDRQMINRTDVLWVNVETNVKDTYGNMHDKAVVISLSNNSITFNANKEYSKLKCIITVLDGKSGGGIIQIESEQGILYTSQEILSITEPVMVDIPINQASTITIKQISGTWSYNMVADAVLYNEE